MAEVDLPELADRAWWAYHCLERDADGKPPPATALEDERNLSRGTFSRVFKGIRKRPGYAVMKDMAAALRCSLEFLGDGKGERPKPTGPVPPREQVEPEADGTKRVRLVYYEGAAERWVEPERRYSALKKRMGERRAELDSRPEVVAKLWERAAHTGVGQTVDATTADKWIDEELAAAKGKVITHEYGGGDDEPPAARKRRG